MNSHPDRSPGSIPAGRERLRFHRKISLWKPYLRFPHRLRDFSSHSVRRRRKKKDLRMEGAAAFAPFSPSSESPQRRPCRAPAPLPAPAGTGSAGKRVTVKELFQPGCLCKCGFNFKPLSFVAAFLFTFTFFPWLPLNTPL